ncbi:MAG: PEP-CTERM sorting domain-containing protein [Phycisphaerae bacterium]|jgi:T5SS/PEP-CTERM-associated repeat protein|nr:PEP-CTERM sorting domain-containing protein [Phycisphaerae bacterium]
MKRQRYIVGAAFRAVIAVAVLLGGTQDLAAEVHNWNNDAGGVFGTGGNWLPVGSPGVLDSAVFALDLDPIASYIVTFNNSRTNQNLTVEADEVTFASEAGEHNTYTLDNAFISNSGRLLVGDTGNPLDLAISDELSVHDDGSLRIDHASGVSVGYVMIGAAVGDGTVIVNGADTSLAADAGTSYLGLNGYEGALTFSEDSAGDFTASSLLVGYSSFVGSVGTLNVESGSQVDAASLQIAGSTNGVGAVTVTGADSRISQSGGSWLKVGRLTSGGAGTLNVLASGVFNTGAGTTTVNTTGVINIAGGTFNANGNIDINGGDLIKSDGALTWAGEKTMTVQDGGLVDITGDLTTPAGSIIDVTGLDSELRISGALYVRSGAVLNVTSQGALSASTVSIGSGGAGDGAMTVDGSSVTQLGASALDVGGSAGGGTGELNLLAGGEFSTGAGTTTINETGLININVGAFNANGDIDVNGGELTQSAGGTFDWAGGNTMTVRNSGIVQLTDYYAPDGGTLAISGAAEVSSLVTCIASAAGTTGAASIQDAGSVWTSAGGLYIGGSNTAAGGTGELTVVDGLVDVSGTLKLWPGGALSISGGHVKAGSFDNSAGGTLNFTGGAMTVDGGTFNPPSGDFVLEGSAAPVLNVINGATSAFSYLTVAYAAEGTLNINSGGAVRNMYSYIGDRSSGTGVVTVSGAGSTWTNQTLAVGYYGDGTVNIAGGGSVEVSSIWGETRVGRYSGSTGVVTVSGAGSTWSSNCSSFVIGLLGNGRLDITEGGAVSNTGSINSYIGSSSSGTGVVTVSGTGSTWVNSANLYVGWDGSATLNITDGGLVEISGDTRVAWSPGSTGAINFDNGTLTTGGLMCATGDLSGTGTINSNGLVSDVDLVFDAENGLVKTLTLNEPGQNITVNLDVDGSGSIGAGYSGNGSMQISDGMTVLSTGGYVGYQSGSTGMVTVSGAGSTWSSSDDLWIGYYGDGALYVTSGANLNNPAAHIAELSGSTGSVIVDGATWTNSGGLGIGRIGAGTLEIRNGGHVSCTYGVVAEGYMGTGRVVVDGGTWTNSDGLWVSGGGTVEIINGGEVSSTEGTIVVEGGDLPSEVIIDGGTWTNSGHVILGTYWDADAEATLEIKNGGTLSVGGILGIGAGCVVTILDGTLIFSVPKPIEIDDASPPHRPIGGILNCYRANIEFNCDVTVGDGSSDVELFFGEWPSIETTMALVITGEATFLRSVTLSGGRLSVGSLTEGSRVMFDSGTFEITGGDVTIGAAGPFGSSVELSRDQTLSVSNTVTVEAGSLLSLSGGGLTAGNVVNEGRVELDGATSLLGGGTFSNTGLLSGHGQIGATLANASGGEVRAAGFHYLLFTGENNTNAGDIYITGGVAEFTDTLSNETGGLIIGQGMLIARGGLTNDGGIGFSGGVSHLHGDLDNRPDGLVVISGGGTLNFWDDVNNDGELRASGGCSMVFFGELTGSGDLTGPGTKYFEDDLRPGSSPTEMSIGGNVVFGPFSSLEIELGGLAGGDQYDRLTVAGSLTPGGTLKVVLIDEFAPAVDDTFDILDWDTLAAAEFGAVDLPDLVGRKVWDISDMYTTGEISVIGMLPGDTDIDWDVDDADYDAFVSVFGSAGDWRTDFNEDGRVDLADFVIMRGNFGFGVESPLSGNPEITATPEPATLGMLALGGLALVRRRKRRMCK